MALDQMVAGAWPAAMVAAADGGVRGEDGREREGEGKEDGEQQQLTSELEPRTVAHGEAGRRRVGARRRRPAAEGTRTVAANLCLPRRLLQRGGGGARGEARGGIVLAPGGRIRRRA